MRFAAGEVAVRFPNSVGSNACDAYHSEAAIRALATDHLEIRGFVPAGVGQDITLLQR